MDVHLIVYPSHAGIDWAAWVEAFAVLGTLIVAFILPRRDRKAALKEVKDAQQAALTVIAKRVKDAVEHLHSRAHQGVIARNELDWLRDEAAAMSKLADQVDLTSLKSAPLVEAFTAVQEAARTASRRLKQVEDAAEPGSDPLTPQADKFDNPFEQVSAAVVALEAQPARPARRRFRNFRGKRPVGG